MVSFMSYIFVLEKISFSKLCFNVYSVYEINIDSEKCFKHHWLIHLVIFLTVHKQTRNKHACKQANSWITEKTQTRT